MSKTYESKKTKSRNRKLEIIQEYLSTNISQAKLRNKYQIGTASFVYIWINSFNIDLYHLGYNEEIIDKSKLNFDLENNLKLLQILKNNHNTTICTLPRYTKIERYKIILEYLTTSISQADRKYKIKWRGNVAKWLNNVEKELVLKNNDPDKQLNDEEIYLLDLIKNHNKNKRKLRKFSKEFKIQVLEEYISGTLSQKEVGKKYNINRSLISDWFYALKYDNKNSLNSREKSNEIDKSKNLIKMSTKQEELDMQIESLKSEVARLKEENKKTIESLEYEKFKSTAYSTLIDVAEKELKISIRKKLDVKQ